MELINTILIVIFFGLTTVIFVMLLKAYKHIAKLEYIVTRKKERANYYHKQLKKRAEIDEKDGYDLGERRNK